MRRICVYCGSSPGSSPVYEKVARALGETLVDRGLDLVYGGAQVGLMGVVADTVLARGGEVHGVIPKGLSCKEIAHPGLTELHVVGSMHERKAMMSDLADGFIALPGGWGTLEEILEMLTWAQLGIHRKPCGLLNTAGYYDHLQSFLDHAVDQGFVRPAYRPLLMVEADGDALLDRFAAYEPPPVRRWLGPDES